MPDATFACPDVTTFCRLDELGLEAVGQRLEPGRYLDRAVDQFGQVIDVLLAGQRDTAAARCFFTRALVHGPTPVEVTTDQAGPYRRVLDELVPTAAHVTEAVRQQPDRG